MITIYHNPKCSKSRQALALLEENNVKFDIVEYLKTPLSRSDIEGLANKLGVHDRPRDMMRIKEADYKDNNLADADNDALFEAMASFPKIIERPIIVNGDKAIIGRPPELALDVI